MKKQKKKMPMKKMMHSENEMGGMMKKMKMPKGKRPPQRSQDES